MMDFQTINMLSSNLQMTVQNETDGHVLTNTRVPQAVRIYLAWENANNDVPFPDFVKGVNPKDLKGIRGFISDTFRQEYGVELLFPHNPDPKEVETLRSVLIEFAKASELKSRLILDGETS